MSNSLNRKPFPIVKATFWLIAIILVWVFINIRSGWWRDTINNDAKGYYGYLPAVFIYHDLNFGFVPYADSTMQNNKTKYDYRHNTGEGGAVNKYYCGVAIAQLPFFIVSHIYALCDDNAVDDGFSYPYMYGIALAAIFYALLGLFFLNKILQLYSVSETNRAITLLVALFGTNLFCYTIAEPGMSHVHSFAFVAMFVYHLLSWLKTYRYKNLLWASVVLGMIMLIRPINAMVVLFVPFLAESPSHLLTAIKKWAGNFKSIAITILLPLSIVFIQLVIYKIGCGKFFVYSYGGEGFDFTKAKIHAILFSYKKGLFLYTPIYLMAVAGVVYYWRKNIYKTSSFLLAFLAITYVFSSWWSWWYGGSFSGRTYIEYLPIIMIGLAVALNAVKRKITKGIAITMLVLLVTLCQIQTWQYRHGFLHWEDMTKQMYWAVFLKVD